MNIDLKYINILKWACFITFSFLTSFILFLNDIYWYHLEYWLISLTLSFIFNKECSRYFKKVYNEQKSKGINFKNYINTEKNKNI